MKKDQIFRHLPYKKKFVKNLLKTFSEDQSQQILDHLKDSKSQLDVDLKDDFDQWFSEYFQDNAREILTIGWDCYSGGSPMSSDYFSTEELISFMEGLIDWENECTSDADINDVRYAVDYESQKVFLLTTDL
jgi:hypothetical protein